MTEEYLTDDEQLEHVKRLASEYGPWMIGAVVLGISFVTGLRYYENHRNDVALKASAQFGDMAAALQHNERIKAQRIAEGLIKDYPGSPYADQANLTLARLAVDEAQDARAVTLLTGVMENSKDDELKHIARLRLARVQIDMGKPDEAINTLAGAGGTFSARYREVRGDAYFAKKDYPHALGEYQAALGDGAAAGVDPGVLELKIADLGLPSTPAPAPAPVADNNKAKP
jgi:predicted negative regulator of RcsB-dependent stress response